MSEKQDALTQAEFADLLVKCLPECHDIDKWAVAVSGGADSLALAALLQEAGHPHDGRPELHVITVDHGLRTESAQEAHHVGRIVGNWDNARHVTFQWTGEKPDTGLQEAARRARYELISDYCRQQGIGHVFMAHHADDQAETVLFRLARGSGLDGLAGMTPRVVMDDGVTLIRPLLGIEKSRLIATCDARGLDYVEDPSNEDDAFARPRLRQAYDVLAAEGLTGRRLQRTARRISRARSALEHYTQQVMAEYVTGTATGWAIKRGDFCNLPEEVALRIIQAALAELGQPRDYPPRMEKQEALLARLRGEADFKGATLGGCHFALDRDGTWLLIKGEGV